MTEPAATVARSSAHRLAAHYGLQLPTDVEAALHAADGRPKQYTDPVAIGGLIVAAASLAWTVYRDLRRSTPQPPQHVVVRAVRLELPTSPTLQPDDRNTIIETVVSETVKLAAQEPEPTEPDQSESPQQRNPSAD